MYRHRTGKFIVSRAAGLTAASRRRVLVSVSLALGMAAALAATASGGTSPRAGSRGLTTRMALSAQASEPGPARAATSLVSGSWKLLPPAPISKPPDEALTVWTGGKMIIYGIRHTVSDGFRRFNVGYNPATNTWAQLARGPKPDFSHALGGDITVWTGSEMLVLGPTAGSYNPATGSWRPVSPDGPGPTDGAVVGWTGRQALVWGGVCCGLSNSGRAYDVAANTWTAMPTAPLAPRAFPAGAWTGKELVVAGGVARGPSGPKIFRNGAAYDPATGSWRRLPLMPRPRYGAKAVWDGKEVLFLGGFRAPGTAPATRGMAYNPATSTWRRLAPMRFGRDRFTAVWTGRHVLVWGGVSGRDGTVLPAHGEAYDPAANTWTALPMAPLHGRADPISVWTSHRMIIWGGDFGNTGYTDGAVFTPGRP